MHWKFPDKARGRSQTLVCFTVYLPCLVHPKNKFIWKNGLVWQNGPWYLSNNWTDFDQTKTNKLEIYLQFSIYTRPVGMNRIYEHASKSFFSFITFRRGKGGGIWKFFDDIFCKITSVPRKKNLMKISKFFWQFLSYNFV